MRVRVWDRGVVDYGRYVWGICMYIRKREMFRECVRQNNCVEDKWECHFLIIDTIGRYMTPIKCNVRRHRSAPRGPQDVPKAKTGWPLRKYEHDMTSVLSVMRPTWPGRAQQMEKEIGQEAMDYFI